MENDKLRIGYPTEKDKTICPYCRFINTEYHGEGTVLCANCGNEYKMKEK